MKYLTFCILSLTLTGCASWKQSTRTMQGPNGKEMFLSTCDGGMNTMADCYELASKQCPGGWDKIDDRTENKIVSNITVTNRQLYYQCK